MTELQHPYTTFKNEGYELNDYPVHIQSNTIPETDQTVVVTQPRRYIPPGEKPPPNYMWLSICTIIFCPAFSVRAIVLSKQSMSAANNGDYVTAKEKGRSALHWSLIGIVIGVNVIFIIVLAQVIIPMIQPKISY